MLSGSIATSKLANQNIGFRNLIINGDMSIAQRGTTSGITSSSFGGPDRFRFGISSSGTFTVSQDTDTPTGQGFGKSYKVDCTSSTASPTTIALQHRLEGQMLQSLKFGTSNAESFTISFWVKSNLTGTSVLEIFQEDASNTSIGKTFTINSANTWEKKTLTFVGDTSNSLTNDNSKQLELNWWLGASSTYTSGTLPSTWSARVNANRAAGLDINIASSTSNEFYITGVQLEVGTSASDFEFLPYDVNLQRCQRYYQKSYNIGTTAGTATSDGIMIGIRGDGAFASVTRLPVRMRTAPTLTIYSNTTGASGKVRNAASGSDENASTNGVSDNSFNAQGTTGTISQAHQFQYVAEAEL